MAVQDLALLRLQDNDVTVERLDFARHAYFVLESNGHGGLRGLVGVQHSIEEIGLHGSTSDN